MRSINKTLADALRILAHDIESVDGVANAALQEAADRIDELSSEVEDLRNQNQEATDRIDELAAEVDDLRNQNHNNRVAAEARWDRIQRLEEAGDAATTAAATCCGRSVVAAAPPFPPPPPAAAPAGTAGAIGASGAVSTGWFTERAREPSLRPLWPSTTTGVPTSNPERASTCSGSS